MKIGVSLPHIGPQASRENLTGFTSSPPVDEGLALMERLIEILRRGVVDSYAARD